jgi:hypothetical protein
VRTFFEVKSRRSTMKMSFSIATSVAAMIFTGVLMSLAFEWVTGIPYDQVTLAHGTVIGAVYVPTVAIFKFALDFAQDGKIDDK